MSIRDYVYAKAVTLCFLGIGILSVTGILILFDVDLSLIGMMVLFVVLLIVVWFLCSYSLDRTKLRRLDQIKRGLPEPYLLGEVLPRPTNVVEQQYYDIMKTISRSAIGTAEQAMREKEDYCAYVESWIHEMKTPLTACSLILSNDGDPRKLRRELKRADNLTETILYYARLRTAEKDLQIQEFQVASVMNEAVKSQMELLIAAGIRVELQGDFTVCSDSKPLCFILKQLLINCAKYCPGCCVIMTAEAGIITVEDNGIGIPEYELRRVTERGFTGTSGKRAGGSTGMGLYIVQELCKQLGMTLTLTSEEGQFTRVVLAFDNLTKL